MLFGGVAAASWVGGELFLAVMGGVGCLMTVWVGLLTLSAAERHRRDETIRADRTISTTGGIRPTDGLGRWNHSDAPGVLSVT